MHAPPGSRGGPRVPGGPTGTRRGPRGAPDLRLCMVSFYVVFATCLSSYMSCVIYVL